MRFSTDEAGVVQFDVKREQKKTIALLKLASVNMDGSNPTLTHEDLHALVGGEDLHPLEEKKESNRISGKRAWGFVTNPIKSIIKIPGKIVGAAVDAFTPNKDQHH